MAEILKRGMTRLRSRERIGQAAPMTGNPKGSKWRNARQSERTAKKFSTTLDPEAFALLDRLVEREAAPKSVVILRALRALYGLPPGVDSGIRNPPDDATK